jgi:hypothetical protein
VFPAPSLTPPTLEDFQWQYGGLTFGANTAIGVLNVEGLDLAEIRNGDANWPRDHGQAMGLDVFAGRDVIFDLWIKSGGSSLQATQLELAAATNVKPNEEIPLWFQLPNLPILCVMCRPRKRPGKIETDYAAANIYKPELAFHATDPRIYAAGEEAAWGTGEEPETGTIQNVVNAGNTEMRPIFYIEGPVTSPAIQNLSAAETPTLRFAPIGDPEGELTISPGEVLWVNLAIPHLVRLYPGGLGPGEGFENALRLLTWDSLWWDLIKGNNELRYHSDDPDLTETGDATIQWASAYML